MIYIFIEKHGDGFHQGAGLHQPINCLVLYNTYDSQY